MPSRISLCPTSQNLLPSRSATREIGFIEECNEIREVAECESPARQCRMKRTSNVRPGDGTDLIQGLQFPKNSLAISQLFSESPTSPVPPCCESPTSASD